MLRRLVKNGQRGRAAAPRRAPRHGTPAPSSPPAGAKRKRERGVALMIAIISIAILTAVATEFAYSSRVDMQMAANQRDDIRAYYLARSGVGLSRLLLSFQKQLDNIKLPPGIGEALGMPPGGSPVQINLWELAKVDCYMLQAMVPPAGESETGPRESGGSEVDPELAGVLKQRSFGGFEGCFDTKITAEDPKLNVSDLGVQMGFKGRDLYTLLSDKRYEFLFEREDANGVRVTPSDLVIALQDWVDQDKNASSLNLDPTNGAGFFQQGFSDENYAYTRYNPTYQAKNAHFDSLDELYMVHGVNDAFMAAFRDRLTVYSPFQKVANINTNDPLLLYRAMLAAERPTRPDPRLRDPLFVGQILKQIQTMKQFSFLGFSVENFLQILTASGVDVDPGAKQRLDNKMTTFTIEASGEAGSIKKKITAVVRMDKGGNLGQLVYWREE